ncbi:hypothetical protein [Thalassospira sp. TSL5-1]|uniref:hypothetical protein n=1 Tax=Thalassospira sp. TSL5-1 TaxID=1544451 RepID=UPI00093AEF67|nr:hypothetical protein [Thalassospira sp. TSL5-1]OKH87189.1 hypothetical protein LF95_19705 [Thalassospira sp. TSL5-1]
MTKTTKGSSAYPCIEATAHSPLRWVMLCLTLLALAIIGGSLATATTGFPGSNIGPHNPKTASYGFPEKQGVLPAGGDSYVLTSRQITSKKHPPVTDPVDDTIANLEIPFLPGPTYRIFAFGNQTHLSSRPHAPYAPRSPPAAV